MQAMKTTWSVNAITFLEFKLIFCQCQSYDECLHRSPDSFPPQTIDDVKYVASLLKREYHVL